MAYYNSFSDEMRKEVLDNFKFRNVIEDLNKNNLLYMVIEKIQQRKSSSKRTEQSRNGLCFRGMIRKFNEANNENPGEHFTPREIIRLMVDLMLVTEDKNSSNQTSSVQYTIRVVELEVC